MRAAHRKLPPPGWRPPWAWYLAEAPAHPAMVGNPVPALTLLGGSFPPEKKPWSLSGREVTVYFTRDKL